MAKIQLENVSYIYSPGTPYEIKALDDVSVEIEEGKITGIIGHTGSGKSTFVQLLNGLEKPMSGRVLLDGVDIWENPKDIGKIRFRVGLVMQYPEYQLFEETIRRDIAFGPKNMGLKEDEIDARIVEICELVGIKPEYFEKSPFDLSGGEKRRVAIAGVMAMQPEIIIFDEPVAGLDPRGRSDVIKMIADYRNKYDATVLIISHNMEDMALLADKLIVMNKGELALFDTTENVFRQYEFLKSIGLNVPMVTQVMLKLKEKGIAIPDNIFTVQAAIDYLLTLKKGGSN